MTAEEALRGFQRLQAKFPGPAYKGADLNAIWSRVLACSAWSFSVAIGILIKNYRWRPTAEQVLEQTLRLERGEAFPAKVVVDPVALGNESIRLTRGLLDGTISAQEYVAGLYRLSEVSGASEYAEAARRKEASMQQGEGGR